MKGGGMVKSKPSFSPEGIESEIPTDGNKGKASKPKNYKGKKPRNKPSPELEAENDFHSWCTDLEGYTFDLGTRAPNKNTRAMNELE